MATLIKERRVVPASPPSPDEKVLRLAPDADLEALKGELAAATRIEVSFPKFGEGRGYSLARLLRTRYGYRGELRAVGHITRDHLLFLQLVGFDACELREGEDGEEALAGFDVFPSHYQKGYAR